MTWGELLTVELIENRGQREYKVKFYLAHSNEVPLIIGFKDLLDKFGLYLNFKKNLAYLEYMEEGKEVRTEVR